MPTIWFDFDNSPHVPVLLPIAREMRNRGYKTFFTARDVAQTVALLENAGEQHVVIDQIFPKQTVKKYYHTIIHSRHLKQVLKYVRPVCGVSHCSRSAILGAWLLGIPSLTMYDYEYINKAIQNRFCTKVLIPEAVDDQAVNDAGINPKNLSRFPGLKEQLYLGDYQPTPYFYDTYGIPNNGRVIITFRPPAENSHYHNSDVDRITAALLEKIRLHKENLFVIITPRTEAQRLRFDQFLTKHQVEHLIPECPLPGDDLIYHSDILITGGGTMVREAAVLGVPAYSIFKGKKGAVDKKLEQQKRLFFVDSPEQVSQIDFTKRNRDINLIQASENQRQYICDQVEEMIPVVFQAGKKKTRNTQVFAVQDLH